MRKLLCMMLGLLFLCVQVYAQNRTVSGTVTDDKGNPLPNVSVQVKGTRIGVTTNSAGIYTISVPANGKTLVFSSIDRDGQEVSLGADATVNVSLKAADQSMQEVVVVGYQTVRRKDVTGSIATVSGKELADKPIASFTQALQGKAPGVQITGQSGRPGSNAFIRIRGTGSINASSEPLIIIDGISVPTSAYSMLNPNDIEDVSVLKDAAATSIYGSRGSNGVMIITTKKGKGQPTVSYSFQYGQSKAQDLKNVRLMNSMEKLQYEFEAGFTNQIIDSMINNRIAAGAYPAGTKLANLTDEQRKELWELAASRGVGDWRKQMLQTGMVKTHEVAISGAGDKFRYYFSLNKSDNDGVLYGSFFNRTGGRLNLEYQAKSWFKLGTNLGVSHTKDNTVRELYNGQALYTSALLLNPYEPMYNANGTYNYTHLGQNAKETQERNPNISDRISTFATIFGEVQALRNLTLKSQLGLNYNTLASEYYLMPGSYLAQTLGYNQKRDNGNRDFLYVFTNTANWRQSFGEGHSLNLLAGTEFTKDKFYSYSLTNQGLPSASVNTLENGSKPTAATSSKSDWALISYFASAQYDYRKRYYLNLSARRDGSSRFGKDNQFANFWAVGATWDVANEKFFNVNAINSLKVRTSYGTSGNNTGIGNYQALGTYAYNVNYNAQPAASPSTIANPNLTWESNNNYDIGVEFGLFKNRLTGSVDYYNRKTKDLLYDVNLSLTTGFSAYKGNIGSVQNRGVEVALGGDVIRKGDFVWNVSVNYTNNDNKILDLYSDNVPVTGGISVLKEGQPIYTYKLVRWAGINPETGKNEFFNLDGTKTDVYSSGQAVLMEGKSNQVKFYGSVNTSLSYKGLDLSAQLYYSGGNYIMNYLYSATASEGESIGENQFAEAMNYWKKPGDNVIFANLKDKTQWATYDSDKYLEKGDYISLRDVTLGYTLDKSITDRIKLKGLRVYVQGTNLWLGTKFRGLPETGEANRENTTYTIPGQVTLFSYPQFRAFTFGVNVKL